MAELTRAEVVLGARDQELKTALSRAQRSTRRTGRRPPDSFSIRR